MTFPYINTTSPLSLGMIASYDTEQNEQKQADMHPSSYILRLFSSSSSFSFHLFLYLKFPIPGTNSKMHPNSCSILSQKMKWLFLQTLWVGSVAIKTSDRWFCKLKRTVIHLWSLIYMYLSRQGHCFLFMFFQLYLLRHNSHLTLCKCNACVAVIVLPR